MRFAAFVLCFLLAGCGLTAQQRAQVSDFSRNASKSAEFASGQLKRVRDQVKALQAARYKIDHSLSCFDDKYGLCVISTDRGLLDAGLQQRITAVAALESYSSSLSDLLEADTSEDISEAATGLSESYSDASEALDGSSFDENEQEALSGLVSVIGGWVSDREKAKAIKRIVPAYAEPVAMLTNLMKNDFTVQYNSPCRPEFRDGRRPDAPRKGPDKKAGIIDTYCQAGWFTKRAALAIIQDPESSHVRRKDAVEAYFLADESLITGYVVSQKMDGLLEKFNKAHRQLILVLNDKKYETDDIKSFGKEVRSLTRSIRTLM